MPSIQSTSSSNRVTPNTKRPTVTQSVGSQLPSQLIQKVLVLNQRIWITLQLCPLRSIRHILLRTNCTVTISRCIQRLIQYSNPFRTYMEEQLSSNIQGITWSWTSEEHRALNIFKAQIREVWYCNLISSLWHIRQTLSMIALPLLRNRRVLTSRMQVVPTSNLWRLLLPSQGSPITLSHVEVYLALS